jgi:hypothetical protein
MEAFTHIYNKILALSGESYGYINSYNSDYDDIFSIHYYESNIEPDIAFGKVTIARYIDFQVFVRDVSFETGYARIEAIRSLFEAYNYQVITIIPKSDILMLGNDEKNRSMFTINFNMKLIGGNTVTEETEET